MSDRATDRATDRPTDRATDRLTDCPTGCPTDRVISAGAEPERFVGKPEDALTAAAGAQLVRPLAVPTTLALPARHLPSSLGRLRRLHRLTVLPQAGMSTAEYAVGMLAACGFAGLLLKVLTSSTVSGLLTGLVKRALTLVG